MSNQAIMNRRIVTASVLIGVPAFAAFAFAAQTGRIGILTPTLPSDGDLPPIRGVTLDGKMVPGLSRAAFNKGVTVLNVWASWCPGCRVEHPALMALSKQPGIRLFGLAADDTEANAGGYLRAHGNPYQRLSLDSGRVYQSALKHRGIPQTYVFRADGTYVDRVTGELSEANITSHLLPAIEKASRAA